MGGYVTVGPGYQFNQFNEFSEYNPITGKVIREIQQNDVRHIQIDSFYFDSITHNEWTKLNEQIFRYKPGIMLRFFGYGTGLIDLSILKYLTNVENLCIDGATVQNQECLAELPKLKQLTYETANADNYGVFNKMTAELETLTIGCEEAKFANTDLSPLVRFKKLKSLFLIGHNKNLPALIPEFQLLEQFIIKKVKPIADINFVAKLPKLKKLHIKGGSIKNLDIIGSLTRLEYLELYNTSCIENLDFIKNITHLRELFLQSINKPVAFPDVSKLKKLKTIELWWVKNLRNLKALEKTTSVKDFTCREITGQEPEDFIPVLKNKTIKNIDILFPTDKKRNELELLFKKYGRKNDA
jgi:hypothetical protein